MSPLSPLLPRCRVGRPRDEARNIPNNGSIYDILPRLLMVSLTLSKDHVDTPQSSTDTTCAPRRGGSSSTPPAMRQGSHTISSFEPKADRESPGGMCC